MTVDKELWFYKYQASMSPSSHLATSSQTWLMPVESGSESLHQERKRIRGERVRKNPMRRNRAAPKSVSTNVEGNPGEKNQLGMERAMWFAQEEGRGFFLEMPQHRIWSWCSRNFKNRNFFFGCVLGIQGAVISVSEIAAFRYLSLKSGELRRTRNQESSYYCPW